MGQYQPLGVQAIEESFSAVASYDIAVPAGWQVFRAIWSLSGGTAGANVVARANGGTCTRQADHQWSSVPTHVVTSGRIAYGDISRNLLTIHYDMTASNMVGHSISSVDTGVFTVGSSSTFHHSTVPTSVGLSVSAGTVSGSVRLERIR